MYTHRISYGLLFGILLISVAKAAAQDASVLMQAVEFAETGVRDSAEIYADSALQEIVRGSEEEGVVHYVKGRVLTSRFRRDEAKPSLAKAIDYLNSTKRYRSELGGALQMMGACQKDPQVRLAFLERALAIHKETNDSVAIAGTLLDMSLIHYRQGNLEQMREVTVAGLAFLGQKNDQKYLKSRLNYSLGRYYMGIGNTDGAQIYFGRSLDDVLASNPDDPMLFSLCKEYGLLLSAADRYDEAVETFRIPLKPDTVYKSSHRLYAEADIWYDIGLASMRHGAYDVAKVAYDKAMSCIQPYYGDKHVFTAYPYAELVGYHLAVDERNAAEEKLATALDILKSNKVYKHPDYASMSLRLARNLRTMGRLVECNALLDKALESLGYDSYSLDDVYRYDLLGEILIEKTMLADQNRIEGLVPATQYAAHIAFLDSIKNVKMDPATRMRILSENYGVFERAIELAMRDYDDTGDESYLHYALRLSEKSKDQLFEQFLLRNRLRREQVVEPELVAQESELYRELTETELQLFSLSDDTSDLHLELDQRIAEIRLDLDELQRKMNTSYTAVAGHSAFTFDSIDWESIIGPDRAIIHIFSGDVKDYLFVLHDHQISAVVVEQETAIESYVNALSNRRNGDWEELSSAVFSLIAPLVEQLSPNIERICVIPDGHWTKVPFETLIDPASGRMLQETMTISYSNSLRSMQASPGNRTPRRLLAAFAPEYDADVEAKPDTAGSEIYATLVRNGNIALPGAQTEAEAISAMLGGKLFKGNQASEETFREVASDYQLLHMSMHALMEDENPNLSRLLFSSDADGDYDNSLYVSELSGMQLNADLAVLSACNTGTGALVKGEGVLSLSRAFHYAGVPSVVHSLWKVPDHATVYIMASFYNYLREGLDKAAALRLAKRDYINSVISDELAHPFYWAGFVVNGDTEPIVLMSRSYGHYIILGIVAAVVILIVSIRRLRLS